MKKRILRYPGGKWRQQKLLQDYFPLDFQEFREPFTGGGVFFGIEAEKIIWINDLNADLISVYMALRDRPKEFIELCQSIPPAQPGEEQVLSNTGKPHNKRFSELFDTMLTDPTVDPALRYYFLNRTSHGGRVFINDMKNKIYYSNSSRWNIVYGDRLEKAAEHLQGAVITCGDFEPLFSTPGDGVLVYADPPYVKDTEFSRSGKLYQCGFTYDDHRRLAKVVRNCPHHVLLSYDEHPLIRELYQGSQFFVHEAKWAYCGSSLKTKKVGLELIITNYPVLAQKSMPAEELVFSNEAMMPMAHPVMA